MNVYPDKEMLENSNMKIIDIRTPLEWERTGIVPGSITLSFYDRMGNYDEEKFLKEVDSIVGKDAEIGLICRSGARTTVVASIMANKGYNVKNLAGGIIKLTNEGYELVPYK